MSTWVPAAGTVRRIRGLHLASHDPATIADAALLDPAAVVVLADMVLTPHRRIPDDVEFAVRAATAQLRATRGVSPGARRYGLEHGWVPLGSWDHVLRIDDPDADDALAVRTADMSARLRGIAIAEHHQAAARRAAYAANIAYRRRNDPAA